jgi:hypothetical protein
MEIIKQWIVNTNHLVLLADGNYMLGDNTKWGLKYIKIEDRYAEALIKENNGI